jgi:hypothetical protein
MVRIGAYFVPHLVSLLAGTDQVQLKWDAGEPTPLQLDDDFILYASRRLLNLVVTPTGAQATAKSFT